MQSMNPIWSFDLSVQLTICNNLSGAYQVVLGIIITGVTLKGRGEW